MVTLNRDLMENKSEDFQYHEKFSPSWKLHYKASLLVCSMVIGLLLLIRCYPDLDVSKLLASAIGGDIKNLNMSARC